MAMTGVTDLAYRPVDTLSGGQAQRVWLASCLAQDTTVLLLDEPTTYLDLRYQVEMLDIVRDLADVHGIAVGIVLHDLDQAAAVADHVVLLVDGRARRGDRPGGGRAAAGRAERRVRDRGRCRARSHDGLIRSRAVARHHQRRKRTPA
jgi:ferric hydroxamate transport system ATP-binding protein